MLPHCLSVSLHLRTQDKDLQENDKAGVSSSYDDCEALFAPYLHSSRYLQITRLCRQSKETGELLGDWPVGL